MTQSLASAVRHVDFDDLRMASKRATFMVLRTLRFVLLKGHRARRYCAKRH